MGFSTAYAAVSWTAGDVITEAKLDNMVANDQAYDSHSAQGFEIDEMAKPSNPAANKVRVYAKDNGGVSNLYFLKDDGKEINLGQVDGWISAEETWAWIDATHISVPSGAASIYQKGDKWKLTANSVVLKGYIIGVADTVLTVVGNALTNHTFTANYYSRAENPFGFPAWFQWTPTYGGFSADPTIMAYFKLIGGTCFIKGSATAVGTSNANTFTISLPIAPITTTGHKNQVMATATDNGAETSALFNIYGFVSATSIIVCKGATETGTGWTTSGQKYSGIPTMFYEIA